MAHLERAIFELWGDVTSAENRVPPPVTSCHLFGYPPPSPFGVTSFMDGPLRNAFLVNRNKTSQHFLGLQKGN